MNDSIQSHQVSIDCPQCGHKLHKTLAWLKANPRFSCACGAAFDAHQVGDAITAAERSIEDLRKKASQTIKLNLKL